MKCKKPKVHCGPAWTDLCKGMISGTSECKPTKFSYYWGEDEDDYYSDIFDHSICDTTWGTWMGMQLYNSKNWHHEIKRFEFNTGNGSSGKKEKMCQRPLY